MSSEPPEEPQWPITSTDLFLTDVIISAEDYSEKQPFSFITDAHSGRPEPMMTSFAGKEVLK